MNIRTAFGTACCVAATLAIIVYVALRLRLYLGLDVDRTLQYATEGLGIVAAASMIVVIFAFTVGASHPRGREVGWWGMYVFGAAVVLVLAIITVHDILGVNFGA